MAQLSVKAVAKALGGDARGDHVLAPGPGHSTSDRSLSVKLDPDAPDGFIVNSFSHDDPIACRDHVRQRLGLGAWAPRAKAKLDGGEADQPVHPQWGEPDLVHWYRYADGAPAFAVARWEAKGKGKKQIRPVVKRDGRWLWQAMPGPRPLYGLRRLAEHPDRQVVVVEGEKKADALQAVLPGLCVVTWSGGSEAHEHTDLAPLKGRSIILWPDNDDPGRKAMVEIAARIEVPKALRIIDPSDQPAKWDAGNAVEEGWDAERITTWAREHAKPWITNVVVLKLAPAPDINWKAQLVYNDSGTLKPRVVNNFRWLLARHPDVEGCWEWNEMTGAVTCARAAPWDGPAWQRHPATDADISQAMFWLERRQLSPRQNEVRTALAIAARDKSFHPVRDYLNGLAWDGTPRLTAVPKTYFGSDLDIHGVFFMRWMVSAVARIMQPGCKADSMIVLEGAQERMKSTVLKVLATIGGIAYFTDSLHDIETKDGAINLLGVWIIEIAELNAFQRKDADAVKSWLSRSSDRYRVPWGSIAEDFPRQCVIAGTLNPSGSGYLRDPTGARRFWPIPVRKAIDIAAIEAIRDQLWAEAVHLYKLGYNWYLTEQEVIEARDITERRYEEDPWAEAIESWVKDRVDAFTTRDVAFTGLGIPNERQSKATSRRINDCLRRLDWTQKVARVDGKLDRTWEKKKT